MVSDKYSSSGLCLPQSTRKLICDVLAEKRHPGLQLDKLSLAGEMEKQSEVLAEVTKCTGDDTLLQKLLTRRIATFDSMKAHRFELATRGSLTLHLSRSGSVENAGIAFHPVYGFVYLPGSGLKGLARAWAETVWAPSQPDAVDAWRTIEQAFGWSKGSERHKRCWRPGEIEMPDGSAAGRIVFHDAWPLRWPEVKTDIVNNHNSNYYAGKDGPGDWEDPKPVYFLAIGEKVPFEFIISDNRPTDDGLLGFAREWLTAALQFEGAGAKTAAGYGRFASMGGETEIAFPEHVANAQFNLCLATPAFLAGADQDREDCDLRPASLRGLLRWWWRTMHTAHVGHEQLRRLETAVWGDSEVGSPVRLAVDFISGGSPKQHPNKNDRNFLREHGISQPEHKQKVTQGLFYASYGMAERRQPRRWLRPAGSRWKLTAAARDGRFREGSNGAQVKLPASILLEQVSAAVWLLARFGSAGSRSRKGFGSFDDVEVKGITSIEDCCAAAKRFRAECKFQPSADRCQDSPALDDAVVTKQDTPWEDPWFVLEQTGMILQLFAKRRKADDRLALGLPRKSGSGRNTRNLRVGNITRHASPAMWSVSTNPNEKLTVRLTAFPAPRLPNREASKEVLDELAEFASKELKKRVQGQPRGAGQRDRHRTVTGKSDPQDGSLSSPVLEKGKIVEAVLLKERTKKGGWRARHEATGVEMQIQNTADVPHEYEPGKKVELFVHSNNAFQWLNDKVKRQAEKTRQDGRGHHGGRRRDERR